MIYKATCDKCSNNLIQLQQYHQHGSHFCYVCGTWVGDKFKMNKRIAKANSSKIGPQRAARPRSKMRRGK